MFKIQYLQAIEYLEAMPQFASGTGVERGRALLYELGNPQNELKVIHVAGTNGKGSVCAYLSSILIEGGNKTGLFTSPHLLDTRERIQIDKVMVSEDEFLSAFKVVYKAEKTLNLKNISIAYFDFLLGMAFYIFKNGKVDYVVMETGLGGRLDATNAVDNPLISVITTISLEHTAILGDTISKIAEEKAGIIKNGTAVVYCDDNSLSAKVIKKRAAMQGSRAVAVSSNQYEILKNTGKVIDFSLHNEYYKSNCFSIATGALYQVMNCAIALTAVAVLKEQYAVHLSAAQIEAGVTKMFWPGRMEEILPRVYVDGAHNPQGIDAFVRTVDSICANTDGGEVNHVVLLFSVVNDKNYQQMIHILGRCRYFTRILVTQTGGRRKLSKEQIAHCFASKSDVKVLEFEEVSNALEYGLNNHEGLLFCTGSLYLAGDISRYIKKRDIDKSWIGE